jgi:DNA-binding response OmpR family regulator
MSKHSILIVDDDQLIVKTLAQRFSNWDIEVYKANTPEQAKIIVDKFKPEVVLLDLLLTQNDGAVDVMDFIKTKPELQNTTVLVLTNLDKPDLQHIILAQGAKEYMVKGKISLDEVYERVMGYLEPKAHD